MEPFSIERMLGVDIAKTVRCFTDVSKSSKFRHREDKPDAAFDTLSKLELAFEDPETSTVFIRNMFRYQGRGVMRGEGTTKWPGEIQPLAGQISTISWQGIGGRSTRLFQIIPVPKITSPGTFALLEWEDTLVEGKGESM